jgi:alcohol dehydrogenase
MMNRMMAAVFDGELKLVPDYPATEPGPGWARIKVMLAGICKTDMEIMKGYKGFKGVLGHEFVGVVEQCDDPAWIGKRVVGEINVACGHCRWCARGLGRHCPERSTLGIMNHDGCMAEYCVLPMENLLIVPEDIPNERAVLMEPLSAACEILEQLHFHGNERIVVLGDGRLGILCAWVLSTVASDVTLVGRHPEKLALADWRGIKRCLWTEAIESGADIVVEATGSGQGIATAILLCRPRGTIVLKSTVALQGEVNLAPVVINELTILGSRCGRFTDGLAMMRKFPDMPLERMITARYPLAEVQAAFVRAGQRDVLKILLEMP